LVNFINKYLATLVGVSAMGGAALKGVCVDGERVVKTKTELARAAAAD
jgi:hypothetical protein